MKGNKILLTISIVAILAIITIICLSVVITIQKPKDLNSFIEVKNISSVTVTGYVPEDSNKQFEFNLTTEEIAYLTKLINAAKVERKLGKNDYDEVGCNIKIAYTDGTSLEIPCRHYVMLKDKWYGVDGYVFDYIYETNSYKTAYEIAKQ